MNSAKILVAVVVILGIIAVGKSYLNTKITNNSNSLKQSDIAVSPKSHNVLGETNASSPSIASESSNPTNTLSPTKGASSHVASNSGELGAFFYPKASASQQNDTSLVLISNDDPNIITTWYKNKVAQIGYAAKSIVQTQTNGDVLNKIGAANGNQTINVQITKNASDTSTQIKVTISAS